MKKASLSYKIFPIAMLIIASGFFVSSAFADPVITVLGSNPDTVTLMEGSFYTYTDPGATFVDSNGSTQQATVTSNDVDTTNPGTYSIVYTANDSSGSTATATRTVVINIIDTKQLDLDIGTASGIIFPANGISPVDDGTFGHYLSGSVQKLQDALAAADTVYNNASAETQSVITAADNQLSTAINVFNTSLIQSDVSALGLTNEINIANSVLATSTPEGNGIGDLAIGSKNALAQAIAVAGGVTSTSTPNAVTAEVGILNTAINTFLGNVVSANPLKSITITMLPKTSYTIGDTLNISGMVVTGTYNDNSTSTQSITTSNISGFDSSVAVNSETLTVTVGSASTTYAISVSNSVAPTYGGGDGGGTVSTSTATSTRNLISIAITTPANKLSYAIGDTLNISGMVVTGTYNDNSTSTQSITTSNISGFDSSTATTSEMLVITVGTSTASYAVSISDASSTQGADDSVVVPPYTPSTSTDDQAIGQATDTSASSSDDATDTDQMATDSQSAAALNATTSGGNMLWILGSIALLGIIGYSVYLFLRKGKI